MTDEALIRWEQVRREHLSGAIALLIALSSASLAFCGSLLTQDSVKLGVGRTPYFLTAVIFFIVTLFVSLLVTLTRLQDVRVTAGIVRNREKTMEAEYVALLRSSAGSWGKWTWWLFYCQLFTFSVGACFLLFALWRIFQSKLFP
jgi:hypothetical protein